MQALRIDANVQADHTVTIKLPDSVPAGPAEVILLYLDPEFAPASRSNGPAIVEALRKGPHAPAGFWTGAAEEIRTARDEWDDD